MKELIYILRNNHGKLCRYIYLEEETYTLELEGGFDSPQVLNTIDVENLLASWRKQGGFVEIPR